MAVAAGDWTFFVEIVLVHIVAAALVAIAGIIMRGPFLGAFHVLILIVVARTAAHPNGLVGLLPRALAVPVPTLVYVWHSFILLIGFSRRNGVSGERNRSSARHPDGGAA